MTLNNVINVANCICDEMKCLQWPLCTHHHTSPATTYKCSQNGTHMIQILFLLANMQSTLLGSWSQFTYLGLGPSLYTWVRVSVHLLQSGSQFTYLGLGLSSPTAVWVHFKYLGLGLSSPTAVWVSVHLLGSGSQFTTHTMH